MATTLKIKFRGLNTDLPAVKLVSGTAREAVNVTLANGKLAKRAGFGVFEDAVSGTTAILGMWLVNFSSGIYVIAKAGAALKRRKVSPTAAANFSGITGGHTHSSTYPGFGFMWSDRWIYGDTGGVSQCNASCAMVKAGLPQPTPINIGAAGGGAKDGHYHCHFSYYNSVLDVEGPVSGPCKAATGPAETWIADGANGGGLAFASAVPDADGYEATHSRVYTTMGNTELREVAGIEREEFSYKAAIDVQLAIATGAAGTPGMNKGDQTLDWGKLFTNEGSEPPACKLGAWTGGVAVYAGDPTSGQELIYYSKFGRPTMVPQLVTYSATAHGSDPITWTDSRTVWPTGGHHVIESPCDGPAVELVAAGGTVVLYTETSTWVMRSQPDGKLYAVKRASGLGCVAHLAAAVIGFEAHAMAYRAWTITTATTFQNIALDRFVTTLEEIPVASQDKARMATFGSRDEVWCAVPKPGETLCRRILVFSRRDGGQLTIYEPADDMWASDSEGITAMCEMVALGSEPKMLLGTSTGRILEYPSGSDDNGYDFPATWRAVFGTERSAYSQRLERMEIHAGDNCRDHVRWSVLPKRSSSDTPPQMSGYIQTDNGIDTPPAVSDKCDGRFWEIQIESEAVADSETATTWFINDLLMKLGRTDRA